MSEPIKLPRIMRVSHEAVARSRVKRKPKTTGWELIKPPPGVVPESAYIAMDEASSAMAQWSGSYIVEEGLTFLGYQNLSMMANRAEYRRAVETIARSMTRKWIKIQAASDDEKGDKIAAIVEVMDKMGVKDAFRIAAEHDGFFGRAHIFIDFDGVRDDAELRTPIGDGKSDLSRIKIDKGMEFRVKNVEPVWVYPSRYNSTDPLSDTWYSPTSWFVMSREIHGSRLLTLIGRPVADIMKPSYSFGGLSLTQMMKPYVENWLRTRQSVTDIVNSFSQFVLKTNLVEALNHDQGDGINRRAEMFNNLRANSGLMVLDKELEDFLNIAAPISGLDRLQAQAQEQLASVTGIPLVELLGISPSGLNACLPGDILIRTKRGDVQIRDVTTSDMVLTRNGWAPLVFAGITKYADELIEIRTSNETIRCTGNHPIWIPSINAFVPAENVRVGDSLLLIGEKADALKTRLQSAGAGVGGGNGQTATTPAGMREHAVPSFCIEQYGRLISALSRLIATFITPITTGKITSLQTSSLCAQSITPSCTTSMSASETGRLVRNQERAPIAETALSSKSRQAAESFALRNASSQIGALTAHQQQSQNPSANASCAEQNSSRLDAMLNTVRENARPLVRTVLNTWRRIIASIQKSFTAKSATNGAESAVQGRVLSVRKIRESGPVYDLSVADGHLPEFFANGILVHNSSEGEIRTFYDWVHSNQETLFRKPLEAIFGFVQLSLFGDIDPDLTFEFEDLWSVDEEQQAAMRKQEIDTDIALVQSGIVSVEEARRRLAEDEDSPYAGIDIEDIPEPPGAEMGMPGMGGTMGPMGPGGLPGAPAPDSDRLGPVLVKALSGAPTAAAGAAAPLPVDADPVDFGGVLARALSAGPAPAPKNDDDSFGETLARALGMDAAQKLKPGQKWITTKTGAHVLINGDGTIAAGMGGTHNGEHIDSLGGEHDEAGGWHAGQKFKPGPTAISVYEVTKVDSKKGLVHYTDGVHEYKKPIEKLGKAEKLDPETKTAMSFWKAKAHSKEGGAAPESLAAKVDFGPSPAEVAAGAQPAQATPQSVAAPSSEGEMKEVTHFPDPGKGQTIKMKQVGGQKGSNPGGVFETDSGGQYYVKFYSNPAQAKAEDLAGEVYSSLGATTLGPMASNVNGKDALVTAWQDGITHPFAEGKSVSDLTPKQQKQLANMYVGAVLTKNWDALGIDNTNIGVDKHGNLVATDLGGTFQFRAQGQPKDYGPDADEMKSLLDPAKNPQTAKVFGQLSPALIMQSVADAEEKLYGVDEVFYKHGAGETYKTMMQRLEAMKKMTGVGGEQPAEATSQSAPKLSKETAEATVEAFGKLSAQGALLGTPEEQQQLEELSQHPELSDLYKADIAKIYEKSMDVAKANGHDPDDDFDLEGFNEPADPHAASLQKEMNEKADAAPKEPGTLHPDNVHEHIAHWKHKADNGMLAGTVGEQVKLANLYNNAKTGAQLDEIAAINKASHAKADEAKAAGPKLSELANSPPPGAPVENFNVQPSPHDAKHSAMSHFELVSLASQWADLASNGKLDGTQIEKESMESLLKYATDPSTQALVKTALAAHEAKANAPAPAVKQMPGAYHMPSFKPSTAYQKNKLKQVNAAINKAHYAMSYNNPLGQNEIGDAINAYKWLKKNDALVGSGDEIAQISALKDKAKAYKHKIALSKILVASKNKNYAQQGVTGVGVGSGVTNMPAGVSLAGSSASSALKEHPVVQQHLDHWLKAPLIGGQYEKNRMKELLPHLKNDASKKMIEARIKASEELTAKINSGQMEKPTPPAPPSLPPLPSLSESNPAPAPTPAAPSKPTAAKSISSLEKNSQNAHQVYAEHFKAKGHSDADAMDLGRLAAALFSTGSSNTYAASDAESEYQTAKSIIAKKGLNISPGKLAQLRHYTGGGYSSINKALRENHLTTAQYNHMKDTASALAAMDTHYKGTVRRGLDTFAEFDKLEPGSVYQQAGFVSTSKNSGFSGKYKLTIKSKTGRDVSGISKHSSEAEVLFPPHTAFRVISKDPVKKTMELEEIDENDG